MPDIIKLKRSGQTGAIPSTLELGEPALNYADGKLYYKNAAGSIVQFGGGGVSWVTAPASATASGTAGQIAYDGSYFYVCTATNTWTRTAIAMWFEADTQAFLTAAGITDATQSTAVASLVSSLKTSGVWSKLLAIYPMVGGNAESHTLNLRDPRDLDAAYRLEFSSGWSHASTGCTPATAYADTNFNPATVFTGGTYSLGIYLRTNPSSDNSYRVDIGCADQLSGNDGRFYGHIVSGDGNSYFDYRSRLVVANSTYGSATGFHVVSRSSESSLKVYRNGSAVGENTSSSSAYPIPSRSVWLGANNNSDTAYINHSNREISFACLGQSLTDAEVSSLNSAVQAFQSALSRGV